VSFAGSLRETFSDMFTHMRHQSVDRFWSDVVEDLDFRELTSPHRPKEEAVAVCGSPSVPPSESAACASGADCERLQDGLASNQTDSECVESRTKELPSDCEMLDLSESVGEQAKKPSDPGPALASKETKTTEEKPKIRMIDVPEEEMPRLPEKQSVKSMFWPLLEDAQNQLATISNLNPEDNELFCLRRGLGTKDPLGQRILQIATIMRNLSFEEDNIPVLGRNPTFIR
jgi:hypothetical protein